jgi:hypothetical protein
MLTSADEPFYFVFLKAIEALYQDKRQQGIAVHAE